MQVFDISHDQILELLKHAKDASHRTYPDPGGYSVALLTKSGKIFEGVSYKSDTLTLTMHSEATALAHAAIHGETEVIAITGPNCHICKQLIWEHALHTGIDIQVVIEENGEVKLVPISQQMPYPWPDENGNH